MMLFVLLVLAVIAAALAMVFLQVAGLLAAMEAEMELEPAVVALEFSARRAHGPLPDVEVMVLLS